VQREAVELRRRVERYRDGRGALAVRGRTVIVYSAVLCSPAT